MITISTEFEIYFNSVLLSTDDYRFVKGKLMVRDLSKVLHQTHVGNTITIKKVGLPTIMYKNLIEAVDSTNVEYQEIVGQSYYVIKLPDEYANT